MNAVPSVMKYFKTKFYRKKSRNRKVGTQYRTLLPKSENFIRGLTPQCSGYFCKSFEIRLSARRHNWGLYSPS
jgi:hypothetical protein